MTKEELLGEAEDLLRTVPHRSLIREGREEGVSWVERLYAVIESWDPAKEPILREYIREAQSPITIQATAGLASVLMLLHQARHALRMETVGPLSAAVERGAVFVYFDELRRIIETAQRDVFFVDPYLDAEFVARYLPHVAGGVRVRLLARERLAPLLPAVDAFARQFGTPIEVRSGRGFHDRYVFIDGVACYQSGASFKDGARTAPTTLTQITDAFAAVRDTYEGIWAQSNVER